MRKLKFALAAAGIASLVLVGGCSLLGGSSPTATFKAFYEASKKKDVDGLKKTMSKGSLDMMEKVAKASNKSLDDMLKEGPGNNVPDKMPETRNEKIDGDKATLEVKKDKGDGWDPVPFVKEDGTWKIAFDKAMDMPDAKPSTTP